MGSGSADFLGIRDKAAPFLWDKGLGGGGHSKKFLTWRLRPEVQTLTLLFIIFDRKGTPFVYFPQKMDFY